MDGPGPRHTGMDGASAGTVDKLGVLVDPGVGQVETSRTQKSVSERKELPQSLHQPGPPWRDPRCSATTLRSCLCGSRSGLPAAGWLTRQAACECSASNSCVLILLNMHRLPNSAFSKLASPARTPLPRLPCSLPARKAIAPLLAGVPSEFLQGFGL